MTERPAQYEFAKTAQKWRALAEKRRDYFAELYRSGRWKLYYDEDRLLLRMRDVVGICERWAQVAPTESAPAEPQSGAREPAAPLERRDAA
jgi:hypothetical protein